MLALLEVGVVFERAARVECLDGVVFEIGDGRAWALCDRVGLGTLLLLRVCDELSETCKSVRVRA